MKQLGYITTLLCSILFIAACTSSTSSSHSGFVGKWVFNDSIAVVESKPFEIIDISSAKDNYIFTYHGNKYPATVDKGVLSISLNQQKQEAALDNNDQLIFNGETFVRLEKTTLNKLLGNWLVIQDSIKEKMHENVMQISLDESKNRIKIEWGSDENGQFKSGFDYSKDIKLHETDALDGKRVVVPGTYSYDEYILLKLWDNNSKLKLINFGHSDNDPLTVLWYTKSK